MYLDEVTAKLFVMLAVALLIIIFAQLAFVFDTNKENKELRRQNRKLRRHIADIQITDENPHDTYRAAFERNMKRNTADPARHAKEEPYV